MLRISAGRNSSSAIRISAVCDSERRASVLAHASFFFCLRGDAYGIRCIVPFVWRI